MMAYTEDHIALAAEYALGTLDAGERSSGPEALEKHVLHGVVQVADGGFLTPARGEVAADDVEVDVGELDTGMRIPPGGGRDHRPAGRFG